MNILSIQSEVVFGHVGNAAARFALQRLGHDVWALPSVLLSNHAGYATVAGEALPAARLTALVDGLAGNGWIGGCDGVISGYLGTAEQAVAVAEAVQRVKTANPAARYCLDPVFGDDGRAYARPGVAEAMARTLLPLADIVTPNAFELSSLTSCPVRDPQEALVAARRLGRPLVLATSVPQGERIGTLALTGGEAWFATTPKLARVPHGAGDLFAALFFAHSLSGRTAEGALEASTRAVFHILEESAGAEEMHLIEMQAVLADPPPLPEMTVAKIA